MPVVMADQAVPAEMQVAAGVPGAPVVRGVPGGRAALVVVRTEMGSSAATVERQVTAEQEVPEVLAVAPMAVELAALVEAEVMGVLAAPAEPWRILFPSVDGDIPEVLAALADPAA